MNTAQTLSQTVGEVVAAAMKADGKTQREVAGAAGIPLVSLNRKLGGHRPFTVTELASVAGVLDISLVDLVLRAEREMNRTIAA